MAQVERVCSKKKGIKTIHVDMGYRGHDDDGPVRLASLTCFPWINQRLLYV
jgi:hypothetical protein